ncbi:HNH endonuclease [Sphaerospermopsis aphanizomenoides BCCUSP55]|uniref:HNH endonuclease n=1 Tax=Sphaerospermopsis aphanizomenoides TaxID=459663 RepID=UPI0019076DA3|nr:HNH endonuclease [Sphaerospermopsis aphanizomenoides]MBK1988909.1 HNH endonuclease [Sphaerospermopsis aphanizomenoides BCCUSP55]
MDTLTLYCQKLSDLNVSSSKKRGTALHKPILILSVIDLISRDIIDNNEIRVSDELIETFEKYWQIIGSHSYTGGLHYPFFHLQSEGFWHLEFKPDFNGLQPKTTNRLKQAVYCAYLDIELFELLQDELCRKELLDALIAAFFPDINNQIESILQINQNFENEKISPEYIGNKPKYSLKKTIIRNAFFRKAVVSVYECQCAFCGLIVNKSINQNIVDGAHIKPFAQFYDSRIHNGIALCKNHHWAFDRGWFAVDEKYKIIVSKELEEVSPHAKPIKDFHGEKLILPRIEKYFPDIEALQWHRYNIFQT